MRPARAGFRTGFVRRLRNFTRNRLALLADFRLAGLGLETSGADIHLRRALRWIGRRKAQCRRNLCFGRGFFGDRQPEGHFLSVCPPKGSARVRKWCQSSLILVGSRIRRTRVRDTGQSSRHGIDCRYGAIDWIFGSDSCNPTLSFRSDRFCRGLGATSHRKRNLYGCWLNRR